MKVCWREFVTVKLFIEVFDNIVYLSLLSPQHERIPVTFDILSPVPSFASLQRILHLVFPGRLLFFGCVFYCYTVLWMISTHLLNFTSELRIGFCLFVFGATTPSGTGTPYSRGFYSTHNDAPQSAGLLWTRDQLVAKTSTRQHTQHSHQTYVHAPGGIRTHNISRRAATDIRLRPLGYWDRREMLWYLEMNDDFISNTCKRGIMQVSKVNKPTDSLVVQWLG